MHSGVMWCLFLFVLVVGNEPVRASGATWGLPTDDKVAMVLKPSQLLLGSCPKGPAPIMNVRLQTLKAETCDSGFVDVCSGCLAIGSNLLTKTRAATACSNMNSKANLITFSSAAELATFRTYMIGTYGISDPKNLWVDLTLSGTVWSWRGGYVQTTANGNVDWNVVKPTTGNACPVIRSTLSYLLIASLALTLTSLFATN